MKASHRKVVPFVLSLVILALLVAVALAQSGGYDLSWWTVDGGGDMLSTGNEFELSGTTGQSDAGITMTGGDFELSSGFWPGVNTTPPAYPGDLDCDCDLDIALDGEAFIMALLDADQYAATYVGCDVLNGDFNQDGVLDGLDIQGFVEAFLP